MASFVDHLTWRWIFIVNIPIGIGALFATSLSLRLPFNRRDHRIDWTGSVLLIGGVTCLILVSTWGGKQYEWASPVTVSLAVLSGAFTVAFCWWEARTEEAILPMRLFRNPVFAVSMIIIFCVGSAFYSSDSFLPLFLQAVTGTSATKSGLLLVPLMAGITVSALVTGRLTARTGRYKHWPLLGLGSVSAGVLMLSRLQPDTPRGLVSVAMLLLGLGLGATMPTVTLAVQNSVDWTDLGVASSAITFVRSLGGAMGLAAYGAVFSARIQNLPPDIAKVVESPDQIKTIAEALHTEVIGTLAYAIRGVFLLALPVMLVAWGASFFLKGIPLRESSALERSKVDLDGEAAAAIEAEAAASAF